MDPQQLQIVLAQLAQALGLPPPPPLAPDQIASTYSTMSQLLKALGLAANSGDPADAAAAQAGYDQREMQTGDAMAQFPANDQQSGQALEQIMGTAQQLPQSLSGIGQSFGGVFGGFFQALNQVLQQGVQAGSQMAGAFGKGGQGAALAGELPEDALGDALGAGGGLFGAGAGAAGAAGGALEATAPAGNLGPPPTPSAGTFPASSQAQPPVPPSAEPAGAPRGGMGGIPMMPPGAMGGATGSNDAKPDTKRIVGPTVKNGAPVQGRFTTPRSAPEVIKRIEGKPVASRRILSPDRKPDDDDETPESNR
ncbi:hypothetical protein [Mycobacterium sp.]|uniref:hypothetical protein n=1 Tax=Mycobacterium sp. TaxID=1785 RepID=UPI0031E204EC